MKDFLAQLYFLTGCRFRKIMAIFFVIGQMACVSSQEQAKMQQARQHRADDFRYALGEFAKDGSTNRIYIDTSSQEARQEAVRYLQAVGGIPTDSREADFILYIDSENYPECRWESNKLLGKSRFRSSGDGANFVYVSAILTKVRGLANSPVVVFAGESSDCGYIMQRNRLVGLVAAQALKNFSAPSCTSDNQSLRPYYFRCSQLSITAASRPSSISSTSIQSGRLSMMLNGLIQANRLTRVRIKASDHLLVPSALFINEIGGVAVLSGEAEFILKVDTTRSSRCGRGESPVGIFVSLTAASGNILSTAGLDTCTSLYKHDGERALLTRLLSSPQFNS